MSGDYSRKSFDKKKHYNAVQLQQGRVILDSDWNEQSDILRYINQTEIKDIIGKTGVPIDNAGFMIKISSDGNDFEVSEGRIYVDGILCELDKTQQPVTYQNQPYYPEPDKSYFLMSPVAGPIKSPVTSPPESPPYTDFIGLKDGTYIVYLDVWEKEVTALDDPLIKEVAIGNADTSTRLQVVWQIKLLEVTLPEGESSACSVKFPEWVNLVSPPGGKLNARTVPDKTEDNVCLPSSSAGYNSLENQLYRVQVHKGGNRNQARFKWSRENGSVLTKITKVDGSIITVADLGKDEILGFQSGNWVEIIDEDAGYCGSTKALFQIDTITPETNEITLKSSAIEYKDKKNLKLCRWDQSGTSVTSDGVQMDSGWMDLEYGIEIHFSEGTYKEGDYWLIPARTATGEIEWPPYELPNLNPEAQKPKGINHHYARLALVEVNSGMGYITDCRKPFPVLTHIEAKDILYDNSNCNLNTADTVQQAIDMLCAVQDLREHNKFVHGQGVVCGLKVICGGSRNYVVVEKGYALDCEGNVIQVRKKQEVPYNIVSQAATDALLDSDGNGDVSLYITGCSAEGPDLAIEQYVKKDFWDEVLEGTLLKNFYNGCIQNVFDFVKKNFPVNFSDTPPIPIEQRRYTALVNLFAQLVNSNTGPYGFISGKRIKLGQKTNCKNTKEVEKYEDLILRCLYKDLRDLLDSETFCGIYDNDDVFPKYEIDPGLETIFGSVFKGHFKMKLHPNGLFAYTCGFLNKVYVYDLKQKVLLQSVDFPVSTSIHILDIVINESGEKIYGLGLMDGKDSVFAAGNISKEGKIKWIRNGVKCGENYHTLALSKKDNLYVTRQGEGLYEVKNIGSTNTFAITKVLNFNATGMLILSEDDVFAYAAEHKTATTVSTIFSHIKQIRLADMTEANAFEFEGNDFGNDMKLFEKVLYVSGNVKGDSTKHILAGFNVQTGTKAFADLKIEESWMIRLAPFEAKPFGKFILLTLADKFKVSRIMLGGNQPHYDTQYRIPTQMFPMSIVVHPESLKAEVLNFGVNTITDINLKKAFDKNNVPNFTMEPPAFIAVYRDGVIEAFKDVLSHFMQYMKDCFTDKFLVDCPECTENDKVYLASVQIRKNKVYHINNFSQRHYVKTPELWEYWLSTVPILPMVKEKFKEFCGTVI